MEELFLIPVLGTQYGIRKNDIRSVRSLDALHKIPLSPARIAGIVMDGERAVTLANLPVCVGYASPPEIERGSILLAAKDGRPFGFVVNGELRAQPLSPQAVFPLPDYLKTAVFHYCAVHESVPIPIIEIAELHARALTGDKETPVDSLPIPKVQPQDISESSSIRIFSVGGELFAASARDIEKIAVKPGPITPLPNAPHFMRGVTFFQGCLLPVIDLSQCINRQASPPESMMLISRIGDASLGLLIDSDVAELSSDEAEIKPAPLIVQTGWLKHIAVRTGKPIPLIGLDVLLSEHLAADEPLSQRYKPDSRFSREFFKDEVEVVEFSLLGERYALPKIEVEDIVSAKPCRPIHAAPAIVIGVAEHSGEILPVVDLAAIFGRRSCLTPTWRMILVKNGNFRALVITETVFGERRLQPEIHRAVPVQLPGNLMYGCYPDGKGVRIILNIEAVTVHFEKPLRREDFSSSSEMSMPPASSAYDFPGNNAGDAPQAQTAEPPGAEYSTAGSPAPATRGENAEHPKQITPLHGSLNKAGNAVGASSNVEETLHRDDVVLAEQDSGRDSVSEYHAQESTHAGPRQTGFVQELAWPFEAPAPTASANKPDADAASADLEADLIAASSVHASQTRGPWKRQIAFDTAVAVVIAALLHFSGILDKEGLDESVKPSLLAKIRLHDKLPGFASAPKSPLIAPADKTTKHAGAPAQQPEAQANTERNAKRQRAPAHPTNSPAGLPDSKGEAVAPLELVIPRDMARIAINEYIVKEGDTLWSISERFTGNPFNYPRIAGENRIANQQLIFPGQRIRLIKE